MKNNDENPFSFTIEKNETIDSCFDLFVEIDLDNPLSADFILNDLRFVRDFDAKCIENAYSVTCLKCNSNIYVDFFQYASMLKIVLVCFVSYDCTMHDAINQ